MGLKMLCNPELVRMALWACEEMEKKSQSKSSFVPPGGGQEDPNAAAAAGGVAMPPGGGGMPPGGAMPPGGGGMPPDPTGGMGGGGGGATPDLQGMISQAVQQAMQQQAGGGMGGGAMGGGGAGGAAGMAGGMKPAKPDIHTVAQDIFQVKKMLTHLFNSQGMPLPPDILDGPNRDPQLGHPVPPGTPGSTSDPQKPPQQHQSSIQPIEAMQGASPSPGGTKSGWDQTIGIGSVYPSNNAEFASRTANLVRLLNQIKDN